MNAKGQRGLLGLLLFCRAAVAADSQLAEAGRDLLPRESTEVEVNGYLRLRGEVLSNFDLDRGTTPSGQPIYAVPLDQRSQNLTHADGRLRFDLALYAPGGAVAVKLRADVMDNFALGSAPELTPGGGSAPISAASTGQQPFTLLRIKRAYGEALTPFGVLVAGRMGTHWGLGMASHGGDCLDCDGGEAADRVGFITPIAGLLWAAAFDFAAVGPAVARPSNLRTLDLDPSDDVRALTFAVMRHSFPDAHVRRLAAGKSTLEYGLGYSRRWQEGETAVSYDPSVTGPAATRLLPRRYRANFFDGYARFTGPAVRVQMEAAVLFATVEQPSFVPGLLLRDPAESTQYGWAVETDFGDLGARFQAGVDFGMASGDPAPGFGAFPRAGSAAAPGELDAPQLSFPHDTRVDNFRFSSDYRIDRILFSELLGTVTDALYFRPHARARLLSLSTTALSASLAAVASRAVEASSTPSGDPLLGVELDAGLAFEARDGFSARLEYAVLFPLAGFDNPAQGLKPSPAQLLRLRVAYVF